MNTLRQLSMRIPESMRVPLLSAYHYLLSFVAAFLYGFPSESLIVVAVTGTKGKSSTVEFLNTIFETAGWNTALASGIRKKIGSHSEPNTTRMTMRGRFFLQKFLRDAVTAQCKIAFIEMTSEGARQHRHRFIALNALIFLNLAPEHIESHGSYRAYADAKLALGHALVRSAKRPRIMVANADDVESNRYMTLAVDNALPFSLSTHTPYKADSSGGFFTYDNTPLSVHIAGEFSLKNALAAVTCARAFGIPTPVCAEGLARLHTIPGRAEHIDEGQDFLVVVDYAHTPDSLMALYQAHASQRKICVLGSMGGGRDTWKRPRMGEIADTLCEHVILTNEDPCDEKPEAIVQMLAQNMKRPPEILMDRREAIARAIALARTGDAVLITGKGTDPTIYGPHGTTISWSDAQVAREELLKHRV